jgi:hypothetical protein
MVSQPPEPGKYWRFSADGNAISKLQWQMLTSLSEIVFAYNREINHLSRALDHGRTTPVRRPVLAVSRFSDNKGCV